MAIATVHLDVLAGPPTRKPGGPTVALVGNPNAGKTTLFNALTGLRAKTANFPGTTIDHRTGRATVGDRTMELHDLPGLYSLSVATPEERIARDVLLGHVPGMEKPTAVLLIMDATNLERNLFLASQVLELGLPTVVALNMTDLAEKGGIRIDVAALSRELGCPVVPIVARSGRGLHELKVQLDAVLQKPEPVQTPQSQVHCGACGHCPFEARYQWAEQINTSCSSGIPVSHGKRTEAIDRVLTHPVIGVVAFFAVMFAVFAMIFWIADYPMGWTEALFGTVGGAAGDGMDWLAARAGEGWLANLLTGDAKSLLVEGIIGGVGGMLVFLPQICILFFFLSLLEDTGYLARAAFVMDRLMRHVGLPGKAFVPMISAHACAIPAIMATRVIEDRKDRLVTILVLPLFSCSARIPVYAMIVALLFTGSPLIGGAIFTGAYALGIFAALAMAFVFKRTLLRGQTKPLVLELPSYKRPSFRTALLTTLDRAMVFVRRAGTVILLLSILLWAMAKYPKADPPDEAVALQQQAQSLEANAATDDGSTRQQIAELTARADELTSQHALAYSMAGRLGHAIEPVIAPLGFDWQIGIGVISSFAAREVIVSTLAVVYGVGADTADENPDRLYDTLRNAKRTPTPAQIAAGEPPQRVFTAATCASLLVFYVLAMQCLPTNVVTRRETGSWKWAVLQFVYMTALAYGGAFITYQVLHTLMGVA